MKTEKLSQLRHNKEYLALVEIKRKGKIAIAIGVGAICAGAALLYAIAGKDGSALLYAGIGLGVMLSAALFLKPAE